MGTRDRLNDLLARVRADPDDVGRYELAWAAARAEAADAAREWAANTGDELAGLIAAAAEGVEDDSLEQARRLARIGGLLKPTEDLGADEEQRLLRARFREFADRVVRPRAAAIHRQQLPIPDEIIEGAAGLGLFNLSSTDFRTMLIATEELSAASLNAAGSLITRPEILVHALLRAGTDEQKARWLPDITNGRKMVAVAVTEPGAGSDVAALGDCLATRAEAGWLLDGRKRWAGFSARAELIAILVRTREGAGHRGLSLFVIEKPRLDQRDFEHHQEAGGLLRGTAIPILGYRGMNTYDLQFERYLVPEQNLIGGPAWLDRGFYLQMEAFSVGRLQTAGRSVGVMQAALDAARAYAAQRVVFGSRVADLQLAQASLGGMAVAVNSARQLSYRAARLMDQGTGQVQASLAKLFAARMAERVTRDAMQVHGGNGYSEESDVSRYFVDARALTIFEGAEEVLALRVIAKALLEEI